jgi:CHAD domain-containing protein
MPHTHPPFEQAANVAARVLILDLIENAKLKVKHLDRSAKALHEARVALRRLRSNLQNYQDYLHKPLKKQRKSLSQLMAMSNDSRDLEVQVSRLKELNQVSLDKAESEALKDLSKRLKATKKAVLPKELKNDLKSLLNQIEKQVKPRGKKSRVSFGDLLTEKLAQRLTDIEQLSKDGSAHELRLSVKKLRYILEPLQVPEAEALLLELKKAQDILGKLHDLDLLKPSLSQALQEAALKWANTLLTGQDSKPEQVYGLQALHKRMSQEKAVLLEQAKSILADKFIKATEALFEAIIQGKKSAALTKKIRKSKPAKS